MEYVLLGAVIVGITELINRLRGKDYWAALTIAIAALVGGVFGFYGVEGLTIVTGIAAGFGAAGAVTTAGAVKSTAVPRPAVKK